MLCRLGGSRNESAGDWSYGGVATPSPLSQARRQQQDRRAFFS